MKGGGDDEDYLNGNEEAFDGGDQVIMLKIMIAHYKRAHSTAKMNHLKYIGP